MTDAEKSEIIDLIRQVQAERYSAMVKMLFSLVPYLVIAGLIVWLMFGGTGGIKPPAPVPPSIYDLTPDNLKSEKSPPVPLRERNEFSGLEKRVDNLKAWADGLGDIVNPKFERLFELEKKVKALETKGVPVTQSQPVTLREVRSVPMTQSQPVIYRNYCPPGGFCP